jgi:hypothetical protein
MSGEYIRPDRYFDLTLQFPDDDPTTLGVNAKWDRVDRFARLGAFIAKLLTSEGMMLVPMNEENAMKLVNNAGLPLVEREFIFESEFDVWQQAQIAMLHGEMQEQQETEFGIADIDFDAIERDEMEEE